uniref:Uncharacterized protein LOC114337031 n=1 Tax=Diabrotica virgifera virgifera TaxID=50390 RepID=A0A6P7GQ48_DIAVI
MTEEIGNPPDEMIGNMIRGHEITEVVVTIKDQGVTTAKEVMTGIVVVEDQIGEAITIQAEVTLVVGISKLLAVGVMVNHGEVKAIIQIQVKDTEGMGREIGIIMDKVTGTR